MLLRLVVSLYTTRVVLNALGVDDYGVFNVVAGFTTMFAFVNTSMSTAISRFLSYDLGKDNEESTLVDTFRIAFTSQTALSIVVFIIAEIIGIPLINGYLSIPADKIFDANILFQCTLISLIFNILQVPFNASIIAFERMTAYAYIEIIYVVSLLLVAVALQLMTGPLLVYYGIMLVCVNIIIFISYYIYTKRFGICQPKILINWGKMKPMLTFSSADFYANCGLSFQSQGQNIIINKFFGLIANASIGIASQVYGALLMFSNSITTAIRPRIIKLYASNDSLKFKELIFSGSRVISFFNTISCVPIIFSIQWLLTIWLKEVPQYAMQFTQILLINHCIYSYKPILIAGLHASGKIVRFSFISGTWFMLAIFIQYGLAYCGLNIEFVFGIILLLTGVNVVIIVYYLNMLLGLSAKEIIVKIILPPFAIVSFTMLFGFYILQFVLDRVFLQVSTILFLTIFCGLFSYLFILDRTTRLIIEGYIKKLAARII